MIQDGDLLQDGIPFFKFDQHLWQVVRDLKSDEAQNQHQLKLNDIVKFGRMKMKVTSIQADFSEPP